MLSEVVAAGLRSEQLFPDPGVMSVLRHKASLEHKRGASAACGPAGGPVHGLLRRLHDRAAARLGAAFAPRSRGPLSSALHALAAFAARCPEHVLFKSPECVSRGEAAAWNEWTFVLFAMYMQAEPSAKTGRVVRARTVESYISLLKGYLSFNYEFDVLDRAPRLRRLMQEMKLNDPIGLSRRKRRGLRRRHLRKMWRTVPGVRDTTPEAVNTHALLTTAWQVLERGGELAPQVAEWSPEVGPTRADVSFQETSAGRRYVILWLRPLKKRRGHHKPKVPQYISEFDGDGSDAYAALRRLAAFDPVEPTRAGLTPLFRDFSANGGGRHFRWRECAR